jgi:shikimate kinase
LIEAGRHGASGLEVLILMGPPGSGKTAVGHELAANYGFRYTDYEAGLVEKYGPVELFVRYKKKAMKELHESIIASIDISLPPLVFETTALSEKGFVEGLIERYSTFTALLDVPLATGLERIESRPRGRNLSNSPGTNQWIWERFAEVHVDRKVDLRLDSQLCSVEEMARLIEESVRALQSGNR